MLQLVLPKAARIIIIDDCRFSLLLQAMNSHLGRSHCRNICTHCCRHICAPQLHSCFVMGALWTVFTACRLFQRHHAKRSTCTCRSNSTFKYCILPRSLRGLPLTLAQRERFVWFKNSFQTRTGVLSEILMYQQPLL